jgi:hypothetical protein
MIPPKPVLRRLAAIALLMLSMLAAIGAADWTWLESGFSIVALWLGAVALFGGAAAFMVLRAHRRRVDLDDELWSLRRLEQGEEAARRLARADRARRDRGEP